MKENREVLKSFGIVSIADSLVNDNVQNRKGEDKKCKNLEEDEYDPEKEDEVGSEDTVEVHIMFIYACFDFLFTYKIMKLINPHLPIILENQSFQGKEVSRGA